MPYYDYQCHDCLRSAEAVKGDVLTPEELPEVYFETRHAMNPTPEELLATTECPRCGGHDTEKVLRPVHSYIRGYGYLDRAGCHRDMNVHKLTTDDPYASMREPGEADDLKLRLQRAGRQQSDPKHFVSPTSAEMTQAVKDAVKSQ